MRRRARWPGRSLAFGIFLFATANGADVSLASDSPPPTDDFAALGDTNGAIPPGTHGAVGLDHLMVMLKTQTKVQNRDHTTAFGPVATSFFWAPLSPGMLLSSRVIFDPGTLPGRWVVAACDTTGNNARLLVGVSKTGIPDLTASNWHMKAIDLDATDTLSVDYPSVGFSNDRVVVQVNLRRISDGGFERSHLYVFEKSQMYAGNLDANVLLPLDGTTYGTSQVPAATYDVGVSDVYLVQARDPGNGKLRLYKITGPPASPSIETIGDPQGLPWEDGPGPVDFLPQQQGPTGCADCASPPCKIQAGDSRIQSAVYRNGHVWATHTVFIPAPDHASAQWWQIRTDASVRQSGRVEDASGLQHFAYPSIAVNKNDDVLLGYSRFRSDQYAGASYSFRTAIDPLGTMQVESSLRNGDSCYYKDFGGGSNYWGHFSATVVDPTDDKKMWTLQEYAATPNVSPVYDRWGTWWGMLDPTPAIAITDAFVVEGDSGTTPATFDLTLSVPTSQAVTVTWATDDGSATTGDNDYVGASGTVVFAPGETAKTVTVAVKGDIKKEGPENFVVNFALGAPVNATLPDTQAVGSIADDDPDPQISISDKQVLEGSSSGPTPAVFLVTLSNPSSAIVTVNFNAAPDTATIGSVSPADLNPAGGTLTFNPGVVELPVTVNVLHDTNVEANETFFVNLSSPLPAGVTILKGIGNGVILNDDPAPTFPGVTFLTVVSDGGSTANSGRNRLEWLNPVTTTATQVRIRQNKSTLPTACTYPANAGDGSGVANPPFGGSGTTQSYSDTGLDLGDAYCYSVFIEYPSSNFSSGANAQGRPFDAVSGKTRWKYYTGLGATTVAPPTVGQDGVLVPSNDNFVHGMTRGTGGGPWPTAWKPADLGSPAQSRSPIVPFAGGSRAFYSTLDGWVHAIDAKTGAILWQTQIGSVAGAAPAGIFVAYGGAWDYILVGTRQASNNRFYALNPGNGAVIDYYPKAGDPLGLSALGAVTSMATVDYARGQVYFAAYQATTYSLWCLKLGPPSDALQYGWAATSAALGDIDGSPVLRGNRLYVGNINGRLWAVDPTDGTGLYSWDTSDGNVKGFPFPDRRNGDVYFVTTIDLTTGRVSAVTDTGTAFNGKWSQIAKNPSTPLLSTATEKLFVGTELAISGPGVLQYALSNGSLTNPVDLESSAVVIGAPSLDLGVSPNMLYVGSAAGVLYAIEVPF